MAFEDLAGTALARQTTKLNKVIRKQVISKEYLRALQEPLRIFFLMLGLYAALMYLKLPVATVMVLIFLIARILGQLAKVQDAYQKMVIFESGYLSLQNKIKTARAEREVGFGDQLPTLATAIRFNQVFFDYGPRPVLHNASLVFPAGMISAIIGPSGSGKTTVVDLLIGLLRPNQGEILIDDVKLEQIHLRKWSPRNPGCYTIRY